MADDVPFDPVAFEDLAEINGNTLWSAKELCHVLGYVSYQTFQKGPIAKAMTACTAAGIPPEENFHIDQELHLTRFACYLVAMNADAKKPEVAKAQAYFASLAEAFDHLTNQTDVERIYIRSEVASQSKSLNATAKAHGVEDFGRFTNAGYRGMYNMNIRRLREAKKVPGKGTPLDFMNPRELAANLFRITETDSKIEQADVYGQIPAEKTAQDVGKRVRNFIFQTDGKYPEELEPVPDIKGARRRLKQTQREFKQLDGKSVASDASSVDTG